MLCIASSYVKVTPVFFLDFPVNLSSFGLKGIISLNTWRTIFLAWKLVADPVFSNQVQPKKLIRIESVVCVESTENCKLAF